MTKEQMTVHKALAELKVMDSRIAKSIQEGSYVVANKHSNEKIKGMTIADYKEYMKASHNKVTDLINRRNAIKRAVVLSNATTMVTAVVLHQDEKVGGCCNGYRLQQSGT